MRNLRVFSCFVALLLLLSLGLSAAEYDSVLDKVKDTGVLVVGIAQTTPGAYIDIDTGEWTGFTVKIFEQLAAEIDVELEIRETSWDLFLMALNAGDFDVFGSTTFYLPTRALQVAYTDPLLYKGVGLVVAADDDRFNSLDDVKAAGDAVRVGVRLGAVEETVTPQFFPDAELVSYRTDTAPEIAEGVRAGIIDVWAADEVMQRIYLPSNPWAKLVGVVGSHPVGFVVRQGDDTWLSFLNSYIAFIRASGDLALYFEEFDQPLGTLYPPQF